MSSRNPIDDARELRARQTKAEALLWSVLRSKQVAGLKFRRQHPEPPYIIDFACRANNVAVEIDGGYHDGQYAKDQTRERHLITKGWDVLRFTNHDVLEDVEAVAIAIARHLTLDYQFTKRQGGTSSVIDRKRIEEDQQKRKDK